MAEQVAKTPEQIIYDLLAEPFETTFRDNRGGVDLEYVTGEQVVSRLNDVLGVAHWSFRVLQHDINAEADEAWCLGELVADIPDEAGVERTVTRQQFGSQKLKRSRSSGAPLDIGFDLKGAGTDSLKKCASLIGVGLYLSKKSGGHERHRDDGDTGDRGAAGVGAERASGLASEGGGGQVCEVCGAELKETRFKDGTTWGPSQLAGYGKRKHGQVLCMEHYRAANDARKSALLSGG